MLGPVVASAADASGFVHIASGEARADAHGMTGADGFKLVRGRMTKQR